MANLQSAESQQALEDIVWKKIVGYSERLEEDPYNLAIRLERAKCYYFVGNEDLAKRDLGIVIEHGIKWTDHYNSAQRLLEYNGGKFNNSRQP